jgi:transcription elongation factor Elf1
MNVWLQQKYVNILCSNYRNFKVRKTSPFLTNFSCEICGDSQINKRRARAYIGEKKNNLFYYCHNCNVSFSFESYLYHQDSNLFKKYAFEKSSMIKNVEKNLGKFLFMNALQNSTNNKVSDLVQQYFPDQA